MTVKEVKKRLSQYKWAKADYERQQQRVHRLTLALQNVSIRPDKIVEYTYCEETGKMEPVIMAVKQTGDPRRRENLLCDLIDEKTIAAQKQVEAEQVLTKLEAWIDGTLHGVKREIIKQYYLDGEPFINIAKCIKYSEDRTRKLYREALLEMSTCNNQ